MLEGLRRYVGKGGRYFELRGMGSRSAGSVWTSGCCRCQSPIPNSQLLLEGRGMPRRLLEAGSFLQLNLYTTDFYDLPNELFWHPEINWHHQQLGVKGLIAAAGLWIRRLRGNDHDGSIRRVPAIVSPRPPKAGPQNSSRDAFQTLVCGFVQRCTRFLFTAGAIHPVFADRSPDSRKHEENRLCRIYSCGFTIIPRAATCAVEPVTTIRSAGKFPSK